MSRTFVFNSKPSIINCFSVGGPKEGEGPLKSFIDQIYKDDKLGEDTFEKAESKLMDIAINNCISRSNVAENKIDCIIAGDLINQITSSTFAVRNYNCGFLGVYNACSTFSESLLLGASLIDGGFINKAICSTSSHFSSAERQYRYPLELGSTRPPQSQWTVTGCGASMISKSDERYPKIVSATIGKIVDFGVKDANNMGCAMAPSACDTIITHINNRKINADYYDMIFTGDLGALGSRVLKDLLWEKGVDISQNHVDCGELIYNMDRSVYQGGSGAGCSSLVFNSYIIKKLLKKDYKRILLVATGALLSSVSSQQGQSIPSISHAVEVEA